MCEIEFNCAGNPFNSTECEFAEKIGGELGYKRCKYYDLATGKCGCGAAKDQAIKGLTDGEE